MKNLKFSPEIISCYNNSSILQLIRLKKNYSQISPLNNYSGFLSDFSAIITMLVIHKPPDYSVL